MTAAAPARWGIERQDVEDLALQLYEFWQRYRPIFRTKTRDCSDHARNYLSAQLRLETERNFTNIGHAADTNPQNIQHFMSNSPWNAQKIFSQVQQEIAATPSLSRGGILLLDESADKKTSVKTAGAGRQYNGRIGNVDMSQVGTFLAFAHPEENTWTWIEGDLFLPEAWFTASRAAERVRLGVPPERVFQTKIELGWQMIQRVKARGLPFDAVACDELYGRKAWFRQQMHQAQIIYMADVPHSTRLSLVEPSEKADLVETAKALAHQEQTIFESVLVRPTERGYLCDEFAALPCWSWRDESPTREWLVIRRHRDASLSYALCNAGDEVSLSYLARLKCVRHFVERSIQDSKSEAGWDDLRAQKYLAFEHHLALTVMSTWFVAQVKLDWSASHPADASLRSVLGVEELPALSMANVRLLLRAVMPLPELSVEGAMEQVSRHLFHRACSRASRLRRRGGTPR